MTHAPPLPAAVAAGCAALACPECGGQGRLAGLLPVSARGRDAWEVRCERCGATWRYEWDWL